SPGIATARHRPVGPAASPGLHRGPRPPARRGTGLCGAPRGGRRQDRPSRVRFADSRLRRHAGRGAGGRPGDGRHGGGTAPRAGTTGALSMDNDAAATTARERSGRREQNKAENRAALLKAARTVFAEMGYGAAGVRDIVRRTDLASGTFYNYFRDKDEIFEAVVAEMSVELMKRHRQKRAMARTAEEFFRGHAS